MKVKISRSDHETDPPRIDWFNTPAAIGPSEMAMIKHASLLDLKNRVGIHDVVAPVVALKKSGTRWKGLCPFHNEKTPSFHVNPDRGLFKCFGCGVSGDAINFVERTENLSFIDAVETLARRFGFTLEYEAGGPSTEERSLRQELYDVHEIVADHYRQAFLAAGREGEFVRDYWVNGRKFAAEVAEDFRIGFAPVADAALAGKLLKQGFSPQALKESRLFFLRGEKFEPGGARPMFRGRLIIPIRDHQGRIVAFAARQTELTPKDSDFEKGKYVNSLETPIFKKSEVLFNLDRARKAAAGGAPFVMVEGQLDAIRCWSVGLTSAVAGQGTAITEQHLNLMRRHNPRMDCLLDGDEAGRKAAFRLMPLALRAGIETRFLVLEPGADPDELFREQGVAAYESLKSNARSAIAYACQSLLPEPREATSEQRARASTELFQLILSADSSVMQTELISEAAHHWNASPTALQRDFDDFGLRRPRTNGESAKTDSPAPQSQGPEEHLLLVILHHESIGAKLATVLPHESIDDTTPSGRLLNRFLGEFENHSWQGSDSAVSLCEEPGESALVNSLLFEPPSIEDPVKVANEALRMIHHRHLRRKLHEIALEIARKGPISPDESFQLLKRDNELKQAMQRPPQILPDQ
ncbi:MAG TPA: DNA primase [Opitutaceae bacterium]|nr:DNA primase [Opitutaceae bacterium]